MAEQQEQQQKKPVDDSVPKVDGKVAVGDNLDFQRKWWRFERGIWIFFFLVLVADVAGAFGRGYLAKAHAKASDGSLEMKYERIERASTPSAMTIKMDPADIHDGAVKMFVSESVIKQLGASRIAPQPAVSQLSDGGITYTFPANGPAVVELALMPTVPGSYKFNVHVQGGEDVERSVVVVP